MKIGLQYEMQRPVRDDHLLYEETLEQCVYADEVGFDYVWPVEHHFLPGFSSSTSPDVFLAALSRLTKRIRLGLGVIVLPYHRPVLVAERVALLDHLSGGRVDFGTGRSQLYEQVGMDIDPRDSRDMWEESLTMIAEMWKSEGKFEWEGRFWNVPPREILPKPYQNPHPPIWVAALQASTYLMAADKGIGVLAFGASLPANLKPHIQAYRERLKQANPVGESVNGQFAVAVKGYCGEDNQAARELALESTKEFFGSASPYMAGQKDAYANLLEAWGGVPDHLRGNFGRVLGESSLGESVEQQPDSEGFGYEARAKELWNDLDADTLCERGVLVAGDPDSCIKSLKMFEEVGADQVMIMFQTGTIPHEKVMKSIELFGKYVLPEFAKSEQRV